MFYHSFLRQQSDVERRPPHNEILLLPRKREQSKREKSDVEEKSKMSGKLFNPTARLYSD
jgi:hypothetical protein